MKMIVDVTNVSHKIADVVRLSDATLIENDGDDDVLREYGIDIIKKDDIHYAGIVVYGSSQLADLIIKLVNKELKNHV